MTTSCIFNTYDCYAVIATGNLIRLITEQIPSHQLFRLHNARKCTFGSIVSFIAVVYAVIMVSENRNDSIRSFKTTEHL